MTRAFFPRSMSTDIGSMDTKEAFVMFHKSVVNSSCGNSEGSPSHEASR
jgi:hypothetical protein